MKFRAQIKDDIVIRQFINLLMTFAKIDKNITINLKERKIMIQTCSEDLQTTPLCWVDIEIPYYFTNYSFMGESSEHNEIYFTLHSPKVCKFPSLILFFS